MIGYSHEKQTHFIVFVDSPHASFTLRLGYDFAGIFHDYLVGLKSAIATHTIPSICSLDDLDTDVVFTSSLRSLFQLLKTSITTIGSETAVAAITFIEHEPVLAVLIAARRFITKAG